MADNFNSDEIQIGNRRLRKIKRPKQHYKPLTLSEAENSDIFQNQEAYPSHVEDQNISNEPAYVEDDSYAYMQEQNAYSYGTSVEKKKVIAIAVACLCIGLFLGKFFFSGAKVVQNGLQGVVINPEVPKGRSRCGITEKMQGCVLYVMNPQRQELSGRDFYDLASQLTGRQRFVIETGNMRYSNMKIKPGEIAQLNIPPLQ